MTIKNTQTGSGKKKIWKLLVLIFSVKILLLSYFFLIKPKFFPTNLANPGIEVSVVTVKMQEVQLFQELPARVAAYKISEVRPQIEGIIKKQIFEEGSFVKQGQALYQIDPNIYQIAYENAAANLKAIEAKKKRYDNLVDSDAISKQEYDDAVAAFDQAKAAVKKAKTDVGYTKIPAPISGYIGKSNITVGSLVTANQAQVLTTITQLDPIYVDIAQPSKEMIKLGDQKEIPVSLRVDEMNYETMGTLKFSEVFADASTDSVRLRAKFSNEEKKLIPGMFVNVKLHLKPIEAITVPQRAATRMADGNLMVWVVEEKTEVPVEKPAEQKDETVKKGFVLVFQNFFRSLSESAMKSFDELGIKKYLQADKPQISPSHVAKPRIIKAEQTSGDQWVVLEGLNDGEVIIFEGFLKVSDGAKVRPVAAAEGGVK